MHRDASAINARLQRFLRYRIADATVRSLVDVGVSRWTAPGEPVGFKEAVNHDFEPVPAGTPWGRPWGTTWLRIDGTVPAEWDVDSVELSVELGFVDDQDGFQAEGLAYTGDGTVIKGINPQSRWIDIASHLDIDRHFTVYVEAASNPVVLHMEHGEFDFSPTLLGDTATAGDEPQYVLGRISLVHIDVPLRQLAADLDVLSQLAEQLPETSARRWTILIAIEKALDALDPSDLASTANSARAALTDVLAQPAEASAHVLTAVGHAHIDSAWLWPFRETRRKVARTVANVLHLMDRDDKVVFAMSSAQQYAWLKEDHPELYERLRTRVSEGRFIPVGGMWVESDVNMPSGESLVRQLLYGTRFFESEFGLETTIGWLPDSFGYSAALPQILASAGIERFVTQKISWNSVNKFPHHTFWWEGIDGSRVFTHFPSADMYNSQLSGAEVAHAARNYEERGSSNQSIIPFGLGDGGGGPTREMLGRAERMRDLEGSPRVRIEPPARFFDVAERELPDAAVWLGEMYLEFHRGIFTSQARTKQGNRRVERLFREAELWCANASVGCGTDYPYSELEQLWQRVLLLQFHDVLPGSSISWVHREAEAEYDQVAERLEQLIDQALASLGGDSDHDEMAESTIANSAPFARDGVPAHSIAAAHHAIESEQPPVVHRSSPDGSIALDNGLVRVLVGTDGTLHSVVDTASGRELVPGGERLNLLQVHPDAPAKWDAWDLDESYRASVVDVASVESIRIEERKNAVAVIVERRHSMSSIVQETIVRAGSRRVDFETTVDWRENERILKVAFPTTVVAQRWAAETQFGHVFRPTHVNTTWDAAKFEACAHRWVHIQEPGFGFALVNEHSYGHDVRRSHSRGPHGSQPIVGTDVRLSLLRAPRYPDPTADQGLHRFGYAIIADASIADAVEHGYTFTDDARPVRGRARSALISSTESGIVIDTVKLAEDRSGDVIVRTYESLGSHSVTRLEPGFPYSAVSEVDLLERTIGDVDPKRIGYSPFHIRSFRITPTQNRDAS